MIARPTTPAPAGPPPAVTVRPVAGGPHAGYAVLEVAAIAGSVLPPHVATREDATVLVLSGRVDVACGEARASLGPGAGTALARGMPRRLTVRDDARLLVVVAPAGLEALADVVAAPGAERDDLAALLAAAGVHLLPAGWGRPASG